MKKNGKILNQQAFLVPTLRVGTPPGLFASMNEGDGNALEQNEMLGAISQAKGFFKSSVGAGYL